jgi:hypothetical protein
MLWVFSLVLTPWSALHHHEEVATVVESHCTHKLHFKTNQEHCLVCKAHFEKNYTLQINTFTTYLASERIIQPTPCLSGSYAALISTSLRGPPAIIFS